MSEIDLNDAKSLRGSINANSVTSAQLIQIFAHRSHTDITAFQTAYTELNNTDLSYDLKECITGKDFTYAIRNLITTPAKFDAETLYKAMKGIGTDEDDLSEILCTRSYQEIAEIQKEFLSAYGKSVAEWITDETSGDLR